MVNGLLQKRISRYKKSQSDKQSTKNIQKILQKKSKTKILHYISFKFFPKIFSQKFSKRIPN